MPPTPPTALERARDADPEVRYRAVLELDAEDQAGMLVERLSDESWRVRKAAVDRIAAAGPSAPLVEALLERVASSDDASGRNAAAEALSRIGAPAVDALCAHMADADVDVRKFSADILGEIGRAAAVGPLVAALGDPDRNVRVAAAEALGKIGGDRAAGALEAVLSVPEAPVRLAALGALSRIGRVPPLAVLAPLARDAFLKREVLRLLGELPDQAALELVAEGLKDRARGTREAAAAAIARQSRRRRESGGPAILRALKGALKTSGRAAEVARELLDSGERQAVEGAVVVLGLAGDPADAALLARAGADDALRDPILAALATMGAPAGRALVEALPSLSPESQRVAVKALARLRERAAVPMLVELARDGTDEERSVAIEALGELGDTAAVVPLAEILSEPALAPEAARAIALLGRSDRMAAFEACRARVSGAGGPWALRALGDIGGPEVLPVLRAALKNERPEVRVAAAEAAQALGDPEAEAMLRLALADEAGAVRAAAARGLGAFPSDETRGTLAAALADQDPQVAAAAAEALGDLGDDRAAPELALQVDRGALEPGSPQVLPALAAVRALARLGCATPEVLARAASHADPEVVKEAVEVAAGLADAGDVLLAAAWHPRWDVRRAAARALAARGDRRALGALKALAAKETDELAAQAFAEAIRVLESRPA